MTDLGEIVLAVMVGGVLGIFVGLMAAETNGKEVRKEAVLMGAAQYITNERGEIRFEWIKR